jgi:predicted aconitase with swiveling domain
MMTFHGDRGLGDIVEGNAIVSPYTFSPRYDLDRVNGIISRAGHPCYGESIAGKILVCPGVQGGIAGGWAFLMMRGRGVGFAALVFGEVNPVMVQGAAAAGIPIISGITPDIFERLNSGSRIRIDPAARTVSSV